MEKYELVVVGGGIAGICCAISAKKNGVKSILILEQDHTLGGILNRCIHTGFGLEYFGEELTGPEYAKRFIKELLKLDIEYKIDTTVLDINKNHEVIAINEQDGLMNIKTKAVVMAVGCRERSIGSVCVTSKRPCGVMTAGLAQKIINIDGGYVGNNIVILGSGDIGMIMARRFTLEGKKVIAVIEQLPYSNALVRNKIQCLDDFNIPLYLSSTITEIMGKDRVDGVVINSVGKDMKPIKNSKKIIACDTVITSIGLIPQTEMLEEIGADFDEKTKKIKINNNMSTSIEWIFMCGNGLFVHDLVDNVSYEAQKAGKYIADYIQNKETTIYKQVNELKVNKTKITRAKADEVICTLCPKGCVIKVKKINNDYKIDGFGCDKGKGYAKNEVTNPKRHLTTTICIGGEYNKRIAVRTTNPIPKDKMFDAIKLIKKLCITDKKDLSKPLINNILGLKSDIIAV